MFDPLLHQPVRSKLLSVLITNDELPFKALKEALAVTDGNLSSHLSKLEKEEYVLIEKTLLESDLEQLYTLQPKVKRHLPTI